MTEELDALLHWLGQTTKLRLTSAQFDARLRMQKIVYLLQALGHPAAKGFPFGQYIRGPYSSELAKFYYHGRKSARADPDQELEWQRDDRLAIVRDAVLRGNDFLEAVATLHSMHSANRDLPSQEIVEWVARMKPRLRSQLEEGWKFLRASRLVSGSI
jgi:uncharacterized protein YwgA